MFIALSTAAMVTITRLNAMFYVHCLPSRNSFSSKGPVYAWDSLKIFRQLNIHVVSNRNYRFTRRHETSLSLSLSLYIYIYIYTRHFHRTSNWTQLRTYIKKRKYLSVMRRDFIVLPGLSQLYVLWFWSEVLRIPDRGRHFTQSGEGRDLLYTARVYKLHRHHKSISHKLLLALRTEWRMDKPAHCRQGRPTQQITYRFDSGRPVV